MPFVLPSDPVTGQIAPVTWGDAVRDDLGFLANTPYAIASRNSAQSIGNAAWTLVTFTVEDRDTDTMFSTGTGDRITVVTAGLYHVGFQVGFPLNATGLRGAQVCVGVVADTGSVARDVRQPTTGADAAMNVSALVPLTAGQTLSFQVYQSSGGPLNLDIPSNGAVPKAMVRWVATG